jgi:hypothetical protein
LCSLGGRHLSTAACADIDLDQNRIRAAKQMTTSTRTGSAPRKSVGPGTTPVPPLCPSTKLPLQVSELSLVFLAERLELPTASGTDVALAARKLRLLGQLRSGLGPWGAIVSAAAATTIAARAAKAPIATVNVVVTGPPRRSVVKWRHECRQRAETESECPAATDRLNLRAREGIETLRPHCFRASRGPATSKRNNLERKDIPSNPTFGPRFRGGAFWLCSASRTTISRAFNYCNQPAVGAPGRPLLIVAVGDFLTRSAWALAKTAAKAATDSLERCMDSLHVEKVEADGSALRPAGA